VTRVDVDLFAGPGGWDVGATALGLRPVGVEIDADPCRTARAAGHERHHGDVTALDPDGFLAGWADEIGGLIASPPCQGFSLAGVGKSRDDSVTLLDELQYVASPRDLDRMIAALAHQFTDPRTVLVLEPLRWAMLTRPRWLAWEQVPSVLPIWEACADLLRVMGYGVLTTVLSAETFGVPQTRRRAMLVARRLDVMRTHGAPTFPTPTHSRYYTTEPSALDPDVLPWVSMADALGSGAGSAMWLDRFNDQSGTDFDPLWPETRPATTVAGRPLIPNPGTNGNRFNESTKSRNDGVRISVEQAAVLQSFPADYPWHGTATSHFQQIGDAVPPLLARAVLEAIRA
jgi:DNA (cytosine-5)-methyltransferase 1